MKKLRKLRLNKNVVTKLDDRHMGNLKGGIDINCTVGCTGGTCATFCNCNIMKDCTGNCETNTCGVTVMTCSCTCDCGGDSADCWEY